MAEQRAGEAIAAIQAWALRWTLGAPAAAEPNADVMRGLLGPVRKGNALAPNTDEVFRVYYLAGARPVAVRTIAPSGTTVSVQYLHPDHLGSIGQITNSSGGLIQDNYFKPYGGVRWSAGGVLGPDTDTTTRRSYTGQYEETNQWMGSLMDYKARFYSPYLNRMISPDTLIPGAGDPQNLNRFMYARGNPVRYKDPTGHWIETALDIAFIGYDLWDISQNGLNWENGLSLAADVAGAILPVVTGGGMAVRAAMHADDGLKALNAVDNVIDAANAIDNAADAANSADNVVDALNAVCSFSGDTLIATSDGERPIRDIEPGDMVLAFDESTGSVSYFAVTHTWSHDDEVIEYLTVAGEILVTTPEHPFMTKEAGWLPAGNLWVGAHVLTADGKYGAVTSVQFSAQHQLMHNLTVDQAHTYFVGHLKWLVHNACRRVNSNGPDIPVAPGEFGYDLAQEAKDLYGLLPQRQTGSTTIAVGLLEDGSRVRVVNGEAPQGVATILGAIQAPMTGARGHAERYLQEVFGDSLVAGGVSNIPCPSCRDFLRNASNAAEWFYDNRYVRGR